MNFAGNGEELPGVFRGLWVDQRGFAAIDAVREFLARSGQGFNPEGAINRLRQPRDPVHLAIEHVELVRHFVDDHVESVERVLEVLDDVRP